MTNDLVEKLRALHVWPQVVADDHADLLTPRRIDKLYEVGRVSHEAADLIETQAREIERLTLTVRKLQGHQAALESYLREIRDKPVARSSDAWKRHCLKLQAIAAEALGDVA